MTLSKGRILATTAGIFGALFCAALLAGCGSLTPELIKALAEDKASFCASHDVRGGAGALLAPTAGYGQATLSFCRSNQPNAKVSLSSDGTISIEHGAGETGAGKVQ